MAVRMQFSRAIPIFRIFNVRKATEFYVDFLGFSVDWEHRFAAHAPLYMQISRGKLVLNLSEHYGDCCPGSTIIVSMTGLDAFHKEITATHYRYLHPGIETTPWDARVMTVIDPFGNRIRFSEELPARTSATKSRVKKKH
jgi:uncharacterized glyoxalase superfamily protein PhnB